MKTILLLISDELVREVVKEILLIEWPDLQILESSQSQIAFEMALIFIPLLIIVSGESLLEDYPKLFESLRREPATMSIRVVGIAADPNSKMGITLRNLSDHFMVKPFSVKPFLDVVASYLLAN